MLKSEHINESGSFHHGRGSQNRTQPKNISRSQGNILLSNFEITALESSISKPHNIALTQQTQTQTHPTTRTVRSLSASSRKLFDQGDTAGNAKERIKAIIESVPIIVVFTKFMFSKMSSKQHTNQTKPNQTIHSTNKFPFSDNRINSERNTLEASRTCDTRGSCTDQKYIWSWCKK